MNFRIAFLLLNLVEIFLHLQACLESFPVAGLEGVMSFCALTERKISENSALWT
jgi:hypothetical protein